jgi:hypothetical protein
MIPRHQNRNLDDTFFDRAQERADAAIANSTRKD